MSLDKDNNRLIKLSSKNTTDEEIIKIINEEFKKRWKTSYEYTKETAIYFKSLDIAQLKLNVEERIHLSQIALYCFELFKEAFGYHQSDNLFP